MKFNNIRFFFPPSLGYFSCESSQECHNSCGSHHALYGRNSEKGKCWKCCGWLPSHIVTITDVHWRHLIGLCVQWESGKRNFTLPIKTFSLYCRVFNFFLSQLFLNKLFDWVEICSMYSFISHKSSVTLLEMLSFMDVCIFLCPTGRFHRQATHPGNDLHGQVRESQETDVQITLLKKGETSTIFSISTESFVWHQ